MAQPSYHKHNKLLRGVFSTVELATVGLGIAKRRLKTEVLYFAEEVETDRISLRRLNQESIPAGEARFLSKEELMADFLPEPLVYMNRTAPALEKLEKTVDRGDRYRKKNELHSAEMEYKQALRIDVDHIRATFGLGLTYLDKGNTTKAGIVFKKLIKMDATYQPKHKHLFNEFGIKLRKGGLLDKALEYYSKGYNMCRDDENLLYNMARVLFHRGDKGKARHYLNKALELRRDFPEANEFIEFLDQPETKDAEGTEKKQTPWSKKQTEVIPESTASPNAKDTDEANQGEHTPPPPAHQDKEPENEAKNNSADEAQKDAKEEDGAEDGAEDGPKDGKDAGKARPRWQKIDLDKY
jgi:tetratricopeptide (TPR) repeat protein